MIPFGNETVTLVRRSEEVRNGKTAVGYAAIRLTGCSWRRTQGVRRSDNAVLDVETVICRVPADQTRPHTGDLMILGDVTVEITGGADYQRVIEQYRRDDGAFFVSSVRDNARPGMPLPHYAAKGGSA